MFRYSNTVQYLRFMGHQTNLKLIRIVGGDQRSFYPPISWIMKLTGSRDALWTVTDAFDTSRTMKIPESANALWEVIIGLQSN